MTELTLSRVLSLFVAITYVVVACLATQPRSAAKIFGTLLLTAAGLLLPLACIWFSDELGNYVGALPGPAINRGSPGWMVKVGGWILLLMPAIVGWFIYQAG